MVSKVKDMRRPFMLVRTSSVRSHSVSSSRSSMSTWDPDASVRLFIERSIEASPFDDETYSFTSESSLNSPEPQDDSCMNTPISTRCDAGAMKEESSYDSSIFMREMSTAALIEAARDAAQALTIATTDYSPYPGDDQREHFVGYGKLPRQEISFKRPRRACKNRWAASNRRYVDILK